MSNQFDSIGGGLKNLPKENRDFSFGAAFGLPAISDVPKSFMVGKADVDEDQRTTDMCTGFAVADASEDQEGVNFSGEYQFKAIKQISGNWRDWGSDLRTACQSAVKFGSLPKDKSPYTVAEFHRDLIANPVNWDDSFDAIAAEYKKKSFFAVSGPYSLFENIIATLWANRDEKRSLITGAIWRPIWSASPFIPERLIVGGLGHCFRIAGVSYENGKRYLVAPLTNGTAIGDKGVFYFPEEVVNRDFFMGNYTFKDMDKETAVALLCKNESWWKTFLRVFTTW